MRAVLSGLSLAITRELFLLPVHAVTLQGTAVPSIASVESCFGLLTEKSLDVAVVPVERVVIDEAAPEDEDDGLPPVFRPTRSHRCLFLFETPPIPGNVFKGCSYDCLGYGAAATFPWPVDLPCPGSFDGIFPPIPSGYPDPNRVR